MKQSPVILIVDDDKTHLKMLSTLVEEWTYTPQAFSNGEKAIEYCLKTQHTADFPKMALIDMRMPGLTGQQTLERLKDIDRQLPIIIMTAYSDIPDAVAAIRSGAQDYLVKPLEFNQLKKFFDQILSNAACKENLPDFKENFSQNIIQGNSKAISELNQLIEKVAPSEANILITGESGSGKELAAKAVHYASKRAKGPFLAINCGAFTESLLTSELFGHEKGAFTGADKKHDGLFMEASGGSLFLDEIGEMPYNMQVKLLRVLQEKEVLSVGGKKPKKINCRIIAATNRDLSAEISKGTFREDLYYRLNVVSIQMPPLREHKEDIPQLSEIFAKKFATANHKNFDGFTSDAKNALKSWKWPGNVRELENVIERAIILMTGEKIGIRELPENLLKTASESLHVDYTNSIPYAEPIDIQNNTPENRLSPKKLQAPTLAEVERNIILETLKKTGNNKTETAKMLGITRKTLHAKLNRYSEEE